MPAKRKPQLIDISMRSAFKLLLVTLIVVVGAYFLWTIREVVGVIFIAWVFASAIDPIVDWMQKGKIPRTVSVLGILTIVIAFIALIGVLLVPPFSSEINEISRRAPEYLDQFNVLQASLPFDITGALTTLSSELTSFSGQAVTVIISIFGGIFSLLGVIVLIFYMTVEENALKKFIQSVSPLSYQPYVLKKIHKVQSKMGSWLRGQIVLMFIIGVLTYIGLLIIGVEYALVLALLAGLFEFIPVLGPILAAIPAVFFALIQSPIKALFVVILFILIQQLENNLIVPNVMKKSVGLNPLLTIVALLIGAQIAGIVGMLIAVPVVVIAWVFLEDVFTTKKKEESKLEK